MKAIRIHAFGDADAFRYEEAPIPDIQDDEILIRVTAAGVNPVDWKVQQGFLQQFLPVRLPHIPGRDAAGTVEKTGAAVRDFQPGNKVYTMADLARDGTYAEYVGVKAELAALAPRSIPPREAARTPLAAQTAWTCLFDVGDLRKGQSALIRAASGGVGMFAVQLAKDAGARVVGTCSTANVDFVRSLGADEVIDYTREDFGVRTGFDIVLDGWVAT